MISFIKKLFGGNNEAIQNALNQGASIIDVRTSGEYKMGHVKGSVNIPLDQIPHKIGKIKKMKQPIVTCCASGMRSGSAAGILRNNGFKEVYNGGSWGKVQNITGNA